MLPTVLLPSSSKTSKANRSIVLRTVLPNTPLSPCIRVCMYGIDMGKRSRYINTYVCRVSTFYHRTGINFMNWNGGGGGGNYSHCFKKFTKVIVFN